MLIVAHGNSLRALVKHLDQMSDDEIVGLNIPTGIPLRYDLDSAMRPLVRGGTYLDPEAAAAAPPRWPARAAGNCLRSHLPAVSAADGVLWCAVCQTACER